MTADLASVSLDVPFDCQHRGDARQGRVRSGLTSITSTPAQTCASETRL